MALHVGMSLLIAALGVFQPKVAGEVRTPWTTRYQDLLLPEALTLPRYYIAQGGTGTGASIDDPAPMGDLVFDGQDRAVVIVGDSDVRVRLRISFTERPERFALLHASAVDPGYPADEFRRGSVRVDTLAWTALTGALDGVYRAEITEIIDAFESAYSNDRVTVLGVLYNDSPLFDPPEQVGEMRVVAPSVSPSTTGVEHTEDPDPDPTAAALFIGAPAGRCLVVEADGRWYLYLKPDEGDTLVGAGSPRLDMLLTDGTDQVSALIQVGGTQNINGAFPKRFLSYGVNLAHISAGPDGGRGWRGLVCSGGFESNVRHERFVDWLCGSQDVRGNLNIAGEGGKLAFVDAFSMNPGSDEGHKLNANVNDADSLPLGMDETENWVVLASSIQDLQGESVIGSVFNRATVHNQSHQGYDDWFRVRRGRFVSDRLEIAGTAPAPYAFQSEPAKPFQPSSYRVRLEGIESENFYGVSGNYAIERSVFAITDAELHSTVDFSRTGMRVIEKYAYFRNVAIAMAPTSTRDGSVNRSADLIVIDGRFFNSTTEPDEVNIILDGALLIAKENRIDGAYGGAFHVIRMKDQTAFPSRLDRIRVWTRNCVIVTDVPRLRLVANNSDTPIEFVTFDGKPGFDVWIYRADRSPGTGNVPQFEFTDGYGGLISRPAFIAAHGQLPYYDVDPGIVIPDSVAPPELPLRVREDGLIRTVVGNGELPADGGMALASGVSPYAGEAPIDMPRYGPFGFGMTSPADLADPRGTLDFTDVIAFLEAFGSRSPQADLAPPVGVFDFSDVAAFLAAFGAGSR